MNTETKLPLNTPKDPPWGMSWITPPLGDDLGQGVYRGLTTEDHQFPAPRDLEFSCDGGVSWHTSGIAYGGFLVPRNMKRFMHYRTKEPFRKGIQTMDIDFWMGSRPV